MMRSRLPVLVLTTLALAALACTTGLAPVRTPERPTEAPAALGVEATAASPTVNTLISSTEEQQLIQLYERVNPSVVAILVAGPEGGGAGSGFVFDKDGHIVTNDHVVHGATTIEVDFASGYKARAEIVGLDVDSDLAVIRVDAPAEMLAPVVLGDSDALKVGQRAIAIGNPFGEEGTMTMGIISGLSRTLEGTRTLQSGGRFSAPDIIQTDAPINPGNSGGGLFDMDGRLIGIPTSILGPISGNVGIGFAVPVSRVRALLDAATAP